MWQQLRESMSTVWVCPLCSGDCSDSPILPSEDGLTMRCSKCKQLLPIKVFTEYKTGAQLIVGESPIETEMRTFKGDPSGMMLTWFNMPTLDPRKTMIAIGVMPPTPQADVEAVGAKIPAV